MAASVVSEPELERERLIVLSRVFDAPREMVFDACSDPKQVLLWRGPEDFEAPAEFEDFGNGKTRLTLTMVLPLQEDRDRLGAEHETMEKGRQMLARLAEFLHTKELRV